MDDYKILDDYIELENLFNSTIGNISNNIEYYYENNKFNLYAVEGSELLQTYTDEKLKNMTLTLRYFFVNPDEIYRIIYKDTAKYTNFIIDRDIPISDKEKIDISIMMACFNILCKAYVSRGNYFSNLFYATMAGIHVEIFNIIEEMVLTAYLNNVNEIEIF